MIIALVACIIALLVLLVRVFKLQSAVNELQSQMRRTEKAAMTYSDQVRAVMISISKRPQ
jgi:hypothetical protein